MSYAQQADIDILEILQQDARTPIHTIAAQCGVSQTEAAGAIARLENSGVIFALSCHDQLERVDRDSVEALIEVRVTPQRDEGFDVIAERIYRFEEVSSVYLMSGAYDLMVLVKGRTIKELALFVCLKSSPRAGACALHRHTFRAEKIQSRRRDRFRHLAGRPSAAVAMSPRLAEHIACVPPSGIRKFFDIVIEMKDAISLGVGEPDFVTPWAYSDAAIYSMRAGHTHYTSNWGLIGLRRAINEYQRERFG